MRVLPNGLNKIVSPLQQSTLKQFSGRRREKDEKRSHDDGNKTGGILEARFNGRTQQDFGFYKNASFLAVAREKRSAARKMTRSGTQGYGLGFRHWLVQIT